MVFSAAYIAFWKVWIIVVGILANFSAWIALATAITRMLILLGVFCLWLFVVCQAYNQQEYHIPFIGNLAAKQPGVSG